MMFRPQRFEHHTVPDQEVDAIRTNRVLHHKTHFGLHESMANDRLERALRQRRTEREQRSKVAGEPAVKFSKIGVTDNPLAFDCV